MIGDIIRVVATFTGPQAQAYQWVWHYRQTVGTDDTDQVVLDAVEAVLANAWGQLDANISNRVAGDTLELQNYDPVLDQFDGVALNDISALVGLSPADGLPSNVSPYVGFPTNVGRSRGRKFIFGAIEPDATDGAITAGLAAALALFAAAFNDNVVPGLTTWRPGNFNTVTNFLRLWEQTVVTVGAFTGSQYRRLPGRGM